MKDRYTRTEGLKEEGKLIQRRIQNQFHRGGKKGKLLSDRAPYVEGENGEGERRRKRTESRRQYRNVRGRVQERAKRKRKRRIVGTKPVLGQMRKKRGSGTGMGVEYWTKGWESGSLTNAETKGERPGRRRFRHTKEHGTARSEARACGIPTAGVRKADASKETYEKRRYVIPGNEDSVRGTRRRGRMAEEVYRRQKEEDAKETERI